MKRNNNTSNTVKRNSKPIRSIDVSKRESPAVNKSYASAAETRVNEEKRRIDFLDKQAQKEQFERWEKKNLADAKQNNTTDDDSDDESFYRNFTVCGVILIAIMWFFVPSTRQLTSMCFYLMAPIIALHLTLYVISKCFEFLREGNNSITPEVQKVKEVKPVVITPKRVKLELQNTTALLSQSTLTANTAEQLSYADKANQQVVVNNVVIAAFDKEKSIDLTIANEQLKLSLSMLETSLLQEMR
ncbi:hypothetical protein [Pseudomonas sp. HY7a-MNA-CIBAN-0227]|uniref:hypothetical protein n=1 Tax=Pseudomonas sp. HY7a-MNA-CIBAN-0227 TaxID=3140474 RepID=UPI0033249977